MAIAQRFLSLDNYFNITNPNGRIILNNLSYWSSQDRELVENIIKTVYSDETLSLIPSCNCGETKGGHLLGMICQNCNSIVEDIYASKDPLLWFHIVEDCEKFISPQFYAMLTRIIGGRIDILRYIGDSSYNPPLGNSEYLIEIVKSIPNFKRGYNWLVKNLETVIIYLINNSSIKTKKKAKPLQQMLDLYKVNKNNILSNYLPLLNKRMFLMEKSSKGRYVSMGLAEAYDITLSFINHANNTNMVYRERIMAKTVAKLAELHTNNIKGYLAAKEGVFRKHVFSTRSHFTARAVITIIPGPHDPNFIKLPWGIGVTMFRPHILNYLKKIGFTYKDSVRKLMRAVQHYDDDISNILDKLIKDNKRGCIPILIQRNPSLLQGSMLRLDVNEFKKDPMDNTISLSQLVVGYGNGDFDGDEENITLLLDDKMADMFETLRPYHSVPAMHGFAQVSGLQTITKPAVNILSNKIKTEKLEINIDNA